jgi:hypothetical protein
MPPERLLSPQEQTFKIAMSAYPPISSALPLEADLPGGVVKGLNVTHNGQSRSAL